MNLNEILEELQRMPAGDRALIVQVLQDLHGKEQAELSAVSKKPRTPNLHPGAWEIAPDFDDLLPDEFWFGKDS